MIIDRDHIDARDKGDRQITGITTQFRRLFIFRHIVYASS